MSEIQRSVRIQEIEGALSAASWLRQKVWRVRNATVTNGGLHIDLV